MNASAIVAFAICHARGEFQLRSMPSNGANWATICHPAPRPEKTLVILDLMKAVCAIGATHGKDDYADPKVKTCWLRNICRVRVDQDANPDLSSRYGDLGCRTTMLFGP